MYVGLCLLNVLIINNSVNVACSVRHLDLKNSKNSYNLVHTRQTYMNDLGDSI